MTTIEQKVTDIHLIKKPNDYWDLRLLELQLRPKGFAPSVDGSSFRMEAPIGNHHITFVIEYLNYVGVPTSSYRAKVITQGKIPAEVIEDALIEFRDLIYDVFEVHQ